jgi:hypothetical protein
MEAAMGFIKPRLPEVDATRWPQASRMERIRELAPFWAEHGFGTQRVVHLLYAVKCIVYAGAAVVLTGLTTPGLGGIGAVGHWWSQPVFFQKAVVFSLAFELLGLGCGSGPLTLRIRPPIGGVLYWLRPGTVRLPPWSGRTPFTGGSTRSIVDIVLYAGVLASTGWALAAPEVMAWWRVLPMLVLLPLLGLRDKTIFLAARPEHYLLTTALFLFPMTQWLAVAQLVMLLLWWGAATSKLNRLFPFVVAVMASNAPLHASKRLKRRLYRRFPDDLRPSVFARAMAHGGAAVEYLAPLALVFSPYRSLTVAAVVVMVIFHLYILSLFPMGVPMEWNVFMIFATLFLFGAHGDIGPAQVRSPLLVGILAAAAIIVVLGNLYPHHVSFLLSMRYYAGNWATSLWCFRKGVEERLDEAITKPAPSIRTQLAALYDPTTADLVVHIAYAFRAMHHHGRALFGLLPRALPDAQAYDIQEGEVIAGAVLGWNFGEGHLHDEQLLRAVQQRCGFAEGDLRVIVLEAQPIHQQRQHYRILDAASGLIEEGYVAVRDMVAHQPWLGQDGTIPVRPIAGERVPAPIAEPLPEAGTP